MKDNNKTIMIDFFKKDSTLFVISLILTLGGGYLFFFRPDLIDFTMKCIGVIVAIFVITKIIFEILSTIRDEFF